MRSLLTTILLLVLTLCVQGQEREAWKRYTTEDFRIYYQESEQDVVSLLTAPFKERLFHLQSQLNYYLNNRIDIFITSDPAIMDRLRSERRVLHGNSGGFIDVRQNDVKLDLSLNPSELMVSFAQQAARVIFNEMMYGGSMQDQMRSANLVYLPSWVEEGLMHYLAHGWDAYSDNRWRMVYERYGLRAFNRIPSEFDALKGASFFKYIEDHYGNSSLSSLLYMSRLTKKFSTAMHYAFHKASAELYRDWWHYFEQAYTIDQRKRLPVNGLVLDASLVKDIAVRSSDSIYVIRERGKRWCLELWNEQGLLGELYHVEQEEQRLRPFHGSLHVDGDQVHWFLYNGHSLRHVRIGPDGSSERSIPMHGVSAIRMDRDAVLILCSGPVTSTRWRWTQAGIEAIDRWTGYVQDVVEGGQGSFTLRSEFNGYSLIQNAQGDTLLKMNAHARQLLLRDHFLYYLSDANGVVNAKRLNLHSGEDVYLTDYRSDILFHSFDRGHLVEYVSQLDRSALYVSEFGDEPEMIHFDSVRPTYFKLFSGGEMGKVATGDELSIPDSMPSYHFQTPFPAGKDFTNSNYDSLKAEADQRSRYIATRSSAVNRFKRHSIFVQLYNELNGQPGLPHFESLDAYAPDRLSLRMGGTVLNQFNDQMLFASYMVFPRIYQEFDVNMRFYSWKGDRPYQLELMQRHRARILDAETVLRDQSSFFTARWNWFRGGSWRLQQGLNLRYDEGVRLGAQREDLRRASSQKGRLAFPLAITYEHVPDQSSPLRLQTALEATPFMQWPASEPGANLRFSANLRYPLLPWLDVEGNWQAGASWGRQPEFFILGGTSTDVLSNWYPRGFSSAFSPSYYSMVYGIRGYDLNYRNGTSFGTSAIQIGIRPVNLLVPRPVYSAFLNQMRLVAFTDLAYSMYGTSYYERSNALNEEVFTTPGSSYTIQVHNVRNPLIASGGFGLHTELYSYRIAVDWAYGLENNKLRPPKLHISISQYF